MEITITLKNVYGNIVAYPVCTKAKLFAEMCGTTTLTRPTLRKIAALGYAVVLQSQSLDLETVL